MDLQLLLWQNEDVSKSDIDLIEMTDELVAISKLLKPNHTPLKVLIITLWIIIILYQT